LILIISNIANEAAARLVELFPPGAASLITASSFHQSFRGGFDVNHFGASRININGAELSADEITGVVTTISSFIPEEFYYIEPADRKYVCAEMNAFFIYFLSQLNCKKINPPSVRSFSGPNLNRIEWIKKACAIDIPVWPVRIINSKNINEDIKDKSKLSMHAYSVIGSQTIGAEPPDLLKKYMADLQQIFGTPFLSCHFISDSPGKYYLAEIITKPDIIPVANREAIVKYFHN
jgi:hypothetical protein